MITFLVWIFISYSKFAFINKHRGRKQKGFRIYIIIGRLWITLAFMVLSESRKSITKGTQTFIGALVSSGAGWRIPYIWRKKPCGTWRKSPAFLFTAKFTTSILLGMKSCTASTRFRKRSTIRSVPGNSSRSTNAWRFVINIQKWTSKRRYWK